MHFGYKCHDRKRSDRLAGQGSRRIVRFFRDTGRRLSGFPARPALFSCSAQKNYPSPTMLSEFSLIDRFSHAARRRPRHVMTTRPRRRSASATTARSSRRPPGISSPFRRTCWSKAATSSPMSILRARPQGARGESVGPRRDGREAARVHARARVAARRRSVARSVQRRPLRARGTLRLRAIGGDTTSGPLNLASPCSATCRTARHCAATPPARRRHLGVGHIGRCARGTRAIRGEWRAPDDDAAADWKRALERPEPRVALGLALRGVAHAALDISDGLAGDLMHILKRSTSRRRRCRCRAVLGRRARAARRRAPRLHARGRRRLRTVLHRARRRARRDREYRDERESAADPHRYNRISGSPA